ETEKVNPPEEPFRMFVRYRNFTTLHVRIIRMNENKRRDLGHNTWEDTYWKDVRKMPVIKYFYVSLTYTKYHQQQGVELKIDKLPVGKYAIPASPDKSFSTNNNVLSLQYVYISDIAFLNNENRYFVLNRRSGQPLSGTDVQLFTEKYDYK